jgi:two-component system, chemotaxis family, chemotaxis protein CheY
MAQAEAAVEGPRVLIVDDSSVVRLYYRDSLEREGFRVDQAINGIEAMEKILAQRFDLVIVDVNMPRMDGFSFLRVLRAQAPEIASIPALMISTESASQDIEDARSAGANYYLVKPVSEADLKRHVAVLTGKSA